MTTVHEAAIANGWDPADGSPWVGPDGVTYASKDAFYVAQVVDRAQAAAKADNEASQGVAHRDNCLCSKAEREQPPVMLDERCVAILPGLSWIILERLARDLAEAGTPMVRTYKRRWNAAGEGIGPEMRIRHCDAMLFWRVQVRVVATIERAAERQR
jgi:hypothetical protein